MQAIVMTGTGGPEVLQLQELPEPRLCRPDQVKVRLRAAGVNPIDTKIRRRGPFIDGDAPRVPGLDGAGEVVEVGSAVQDLRPGDAVWFCHGGLGGAPGTYAQYAVVDAAVVRAKPPSLSFAEAAALPLVLITAWEALYERARLAEGQGVLVHGGAGGVGHVAIQLARHRGARVFTTVSSAEKAELVESLGAVAIDYRERDFAEAVVELTGGRGVDVALDTVGGETFRRTIDAMAVYGDLVTLLDPGEGVRWKDARQRNLRVGFELMLTPLLRPEMHQARAAQGAILSAAAEWIERDALQVIVGRRLRLEQAAEAHRQIEAGGMHGKIVLTVD